MLLKLLAADRDPNKFEVVVAIGGIAVSLFKAVVTIKRYNDARRETL